MNLPQVKGTHKTVGEKSPLSTHRTGPVAPTSTGSTSLLYVEIGLKGFALEFNSLLALPRLLWPRTDSIYAVPSGTQDRPPGSWAVEFVSTGGVFVFKKWRFPNLEMRYQWSRRRVEALSVLSLQVLLISFQDSVLSKKNRGRNDSIYLGGYGSVQTMCDILRAGVKACTGLKCNFLIGVCPWLLLSIYVCVSASQCACHPNRNASLYRLGIERVNYTKAKQMF